MGRVFERPFLQIFLMFELNNGISIPLIGLGTCSGSPEEMKKAVQMALKIGYRLVDCSPRYENQKEIGEGIQKSIQEKVVKRKHIFIISKLYHTDHRPAHVIPGNFIHVF